MRQSHKKRQAPQPTPNRRIEGTTAFLIILSDCGPSPSIKCTKLGINHYPFLLNFAVRIVLALAPLQTLGRRNVRGFPRPRLPKRLRQSSQGSMADPIPVVEQIKQGQPATLRCWAWDQASHQQLHGHEGKTSSRYRPWLPCFRRSISSC